MTFRKLLAVLLSLVLAAAIIVIGASLFIFEAQLSELLTPDLLAQVNPVLHTLFIEQAVLLLVFAGILLGLLFWILGTLVARPLRSIHASMEAFALRGEHMPVEHLVGAPKEIRSLGELFTTFSSKVEEAHAHDVEISRVKSDFISTAAHQLRTPLTGIRWALEALELENLTEGQKALVKSATDKSHDLVGIVGTLLDISSIESGKYKYTFGPTDLEALAAQVAQDLSPMAVKAEVAVFFVKSETPVPAARADADRIKWVLNNLIENAIRYTPAGGTVRITVIAGAGRVQLRVRDTGIGIAPKDQGNIFERFYRASNAITKENAGNGLGLYIARTIATDHGGDLNFQANTEGPGTTFVLSLPVA